MGRRRVKYFLLRFLRLPGTPGKLALGFALGACVNFFPTFGFGIPVAIFIVGLFRGNIPGGIIGDLLFKPLFPVFFYLDFVVGGYFRGQPVKNIALAVKEMACLRIDAIKILGSTFLIGALINSLVLGTFLFFLVYLIFKSFRRDMIRIVQQRIRV